MVHRKRPRPRPRTEIEAAYMGLALNGFHFASDPIIGLRVEKLVQQQAPLTSTIGLKLFQSNILHQQNIRQILMAFFDWFGLIFFRSLGQGPGDYCYKTSSGRPNVDSLIIHLISKGTKLVIWQGSHRQRLLYTKSRRNLWQVPRRVLQAHGCQPYELTFKQGGFIMLDPRTCFSIDRGFTITVGFGTEDVLRRWGHMDVLRNPDIERMVMALESTRFGMNVRFVSPPQPKQSMPEPLGPPSVAGK